ncbi:MAG: hypothetical protein DRQ55_02155 [Planctomycetota bacterium]|nr:MAG: hypothetical protein DRQ55_02155 [Planctomycetota bacterium]
MIATILMTLCAATWGAALTVAPQDEPAPVRASPAVKAPTTLEAWTLPGLTLPEGVTRAEGFHAISVQARTFIKDPTTHSVLPAPDAVVTQVWSTAREGEPRFQGGYAVLRYERGVPDDVREMLGGLLWGEDGQPTERHPENMLVSGEFLLLLSFDWGDPTGDWLRDALNEVSGLHIPHTWIALAPLLSEVFAAAQEQGEPAALAVIDANAEAFAGHSMANYLAGEFAIGQQNWPRAEQGYARAMSLHDEGADLLPGGPGMVWAALDGLGLSLIAQRKDDQGVPVLRRAVELANSMEQGGPAAQSGYNLACSLAMSERFEQSLEALRVCIEFDEAYVEMAQDDTDFTSARLRDDFRELLAR